MRTSAKRRRRASTVRRRRMSTKRKRASWNVFAATDADNPIEVDEELIITIKRTTSNGQPLYEVSFSFDNNYFSRIPRIEPLKIARAIILKLRSKGFCHILVHPSVQEYYQIVSTLEDRIHINLGFESSEGLNRVTNDSYWLEEVFGYRPTLSHESEDTKEYKLFEYKIHDYTMKYFHPTGA